MSGYEVYCPECDTTWISVSLPHAPIICPFCGNLDRRKEVLRVPDSKPTVTIGPKEEN